MEQAAGRTGITYDQVAVVADTLAALGERPTLRGVRAELGTGSMGTIQKHLAQWQGSRRQIVTSAASLPTEIQRVILSEIERSISEARAELEGDLAATKGDRDALAEDNEQQTEQIEQLAARLAEIEATGQQQAGRIGQLDADLLTAREATERERSIAEQARQALAKAELRLEALPKVEAEVDRLRQALEIERQARTVAEQSAAVLAEKLAGIERRVVDAEAREKTAVAKLAELEKQSQHVVQELNTARLQVQTGQAALGAAARELDYARQAAVEARAEAKVSGELAAELRGKLAALER